MQRNISRIWLRHKISTGYLDWFYAIQKEIHAERQLLGTNGSHYFGQITKQYHYMRNFLLAQCTIAWSIRLCTMFPLHKIKSV